ncbi:MAG: KH domain-containing protein [Candidatus Neomarinimicrobiota bacterium]|nr:KH domain-containing protein [Candidatus Neomarinimicrobiota bacterium]MEE3153633.1 KH domain-containing protein [Candidatus Neomarinimicrobiota bacterium]
MIGKQGRNISALRTLVFAINAKEGGKRARLDVID